MRVGFNLNTRNFLFILRFEIQIIYESYNKKVGDSENFCDSRNLYDSENFRHSRKFI